MRSWSKYAAGLLAAVGIYLISIDTTLAHAEETDSRVIEIELGCYKTVAPMQQYLLESYGEKPLDTAMLNIIFNKFSNIITLEDGVLHGGFGSAVLEYASQQQYKGNIYRMGVPDEFVEHGKVSELQAYCKIRLTDIKELLNQILKS
jgi:deoxyxylulose-5-phosphate synthase